MRAACTPAVVTMGVALLLVAPGLRAATEVVDCTASAREIALSAGEVEVLARAGSDVGQEVLVEIQEVGRVVVVRSAAEIRRVDVPPRLGVVLVRGTPPLRVLLSAGERGLGDRVRVGVHCGGAGEQLWAWFGAATRVVDHPDGGIGRDLPEDREAGLEAMESAAFDARTRAWSAHLRAQSLLMSGKARDASASFLAVEKKWRDAGRPDAALAARAAALEDLNRAGDYAGVLAHASQVSVVGDDLASPYYAARISNARCLALGYLGRLEEAGVCYDRATQRLLALGETFELAVTGLDYGTFELDRGNFTAAIGLFTRSLSLLEGHPADDERGRGAFYLADAYARSGRMVEALHHLHVAAGHFERAGSGRWLGSTRMRLGALLAELGLPDDARASVEAGMAKFDLANAPARIAAAHLTLARIALSERDADRALASVHDAAALYASLSMPMESRLAEDLRVQAAVMKGRLDEAFDASQALLPAIDATPAFAISLAELHAARGDIAAARLYAGRADVQKLSLASRLRYERVDVVLKLASGDREAALAALSTHRAAWMTMADAAGSAVLAARIRHAVFSHSRLAVDMLASAAPDAGAPAQADADALLRWMPWEVGDQRSDPAGREIVSRLDRSLAARLFPDVAGGAVAPAADAALLQVLSRQAMPEALTTREGLTLDAVRSLLAPEDRALIVMEGERSLVAIDVGLESTSVRVIEDRRALLRKMQRLTALLARPDTSLAEIDTISAQVATQLCGRSRCVVDGTAWVASAGMFSDLPWALLFESRDYEVPTVISVLVPGPRHARSAESPSEVSVFVASDFRGTSLADLDGARREADIIGASVSRERVRRFDSASRNQLLQGLASPDAWIHVAAHGTLAAGRIGGAGLWLDSASGNAVGAEYLSGVEILESGVAARVVVLNACQLGSDGHRGGVPGFARTLIDAGVEHVVAANWPVSDTAGSVWVSELYRALHDGRELRYALAHARLALRSTRSFRHPYYWAGLNHFEAFRPHSRSDPSVTTRR